MRARYYIDVEGWERWLHAKRVSRCRIHESKDCVAIQRPEDAAYLTRGEAKAMFAAGFFACKRCVGMR